MLYSCKNHSGKELLSFCFSQTDIKLFADDSPSDPTVPPSPTFCCMEQHKHWFTILIHTILQIILPRLFSRHRQLSKIIELQTVQLHTSFRVLLKGLVTFKYLYNWYILKDCQAGLSAIYGRDNRRKEKRLLILVYYFTLGRANK